MTERVSEKRLSESWLLKRVHREAANASTFVMNEHGAVAALGYSAARCSRLTLECMFHAIIAGLTVGYQSIIYPANHGGDPNRAAEQFNI